MSENRQIARAAGLVGFFTLLSRIAGLIRDAVVGYYFGTGLAADAFFVAFRVPNLLRRWVAEGAMTVAFVPVFTDYLTNRSRTEAVEVASVLATFMAGGLAVLTAAGVLFAPQWTSLFAPGFAGDPAKFALTVTLTRLIFPYIFLISLVALAAGMLNSLRHFTAPALAPILLNVSVIAAAIVLCPRLSVPVEGLAYGVLIGGALQLGLQVVPLVRLGVRLVPRWQPRHAAVRRTLTLMGPMVFGAGMYQINVMVTTILGSLLPSGSVSCVWYADRVFQFPLGIFAVALGTAALPSFSSQAARGAYDELRHSLAFSMRLTSFIVLPATVGMIALAVPITVVLFQRGAFGFDQALLTAQALSAFAVGLWPVSMVRLVVPAFYAMENTRVPVFTAAVAFIANCGFSLLLMGAVAAPGSSHLAGVIATLSQTLALFNLRHTGLALATSLSATLNVILLMLWLRRRLGPLGAGDLMPSLVRSLVASIAMVPAVRYVAGLTAWSQPGALAVHAAVLGLAMVVGVVVFAVVALALGAEEIQSMVRILRQRFAG